MNGWMDAWIDGWMDEEPQGRPGGLGDLKTAGPGSLSSSSQYKFPQWPQQASRQGSLIGHYRAHLGGLDRSFEAFEMPAEA